MKKENWRLLAGFLLAPAIVILPVLAQTPFFGFTLAAAGLFVAYANAVVLGIPFYLLLRKLNLLSWSWSLLAGTTLFLPFFIYHVFSYSSSAPIGFNPPEFMVRNYYMASFAGAVCGLLFWFIAIRGTKAASQTSKSKLSMTLLGLYLFSGLYIFYVEQVILLDGHIASQMEKAEKSKPQMVTAKLKDGMHITATFPRVLPFRANCPIVIARRRSFTTLQHLYWVLDYSDSSFIGNKRLASREPC